MTQIGFPHSDMVGSQPAHGSPTLFAVYHVLLRLLAPRHPPFAFGHFLSHAENTTAFELTATRLGQSARFESLSEDALFYSVVKEHSDE